MQKFVFRNEKGEVFGPPTSNPAVLFTKSCGTWHKVGDLVPVLTYLNLYQKQYLTHGFTDMADDLAVMELPKDQEVIDKVFQNTGYLKRLYDKAITYETHEGVTNQ